ncbi:MAG: endonuclease V [Thermodesulfobacteriota bacterium]|jgi:deoxyinosine 3'endonuclease (endonuclease V)|nr:MAG: endonuclease V [Thermodesulfobacteriota bacterium]
MMIAAFDVHYFADGRASTGAVLSHHYTDPEPALEYVGLTDEVTQYIPGQFYRRELPCILRLLEQFNETPEEMLIDGYVLLGDLALFGFAVSGRPNLYLCFICFSGQQKQDAG